MRNKLLKIGISLLLVTISVNSYAVKKDSEKEALQQAINGLIKPLMQKYQIPGMAIAITINGKNYFYNYGVISKKSKRPVTKNTLFEIASITKTFTATLASYLQRKGQLIFTNSLTNYLPKLRSPGLNKVTLLNLATYTSGLPLEVPANVHSQAALINFLKGWRPKHKIGSQRQYSNIELGLLGLAIGRGKNQSYENLLRKMVLRPLGLKHTYFVVPKSERHHYAQGYTAKGHPKRMHTQVLLPATYALKSTSADLIRFTNANLNELILSRKLQLAINATHRGYFETPFLTQDLVWEQYPYPLSLQTLLNGHGSELGAPAKQMKPPLKPEANSYIDKTGTDIENNFSVYLAFVPAKKIGVVILANKFYPFNERLTTGYKIFQYLAHNSEEPTKKASS